MKGNRRPARGPIVDARRAIATIDESSSEAELRLAEELIAEGLQYAEGQLKGLPSRARYLRDAVTELTAMRETFARTWRPVASMTVATGPACEATARTTMMVAHDGNRSCHANGSARVVEIEAYRARKALQR